MKIIEIDISVHNQYCIEVSNCTLEFRNFLAREATKMTTTDISDIVRRKACPFLQGDQNSWILVEFWTEDFDSIQKWVDYLNQELIRKNITILK